MSPGSDETDDQESSEVRALVLDELDEKLDAFNAFRKSDSAAADAILGELGYDADAVAKLREDGVLP